MVINIAYLNIFLLIIIANKKKDLKIIKISKNKILLTQKPVFFLTIFFNYKIVLIVNHKKAKNKKIKSNKILIYLRQLISYSKKSLMK